MTERPAIYRSIRGHALLCALVGLSLFGGLGAWASVSMLSGAVVASGTFVVDSYVKKVQHPIGGRVGALRVEEGQSVRSGQLLIRLDDTQARTSLAIVSKRLDELTARRSRLETERDGAGQVTFPDGLLRRRALDPEVATALRSEQRLFGTRKSLREGKKAQLEERIAQYQNEISGYREQRRAQERALTVLDKEIGTLKGLYERKLVSFQRLSALEREAATYGGDRGEVIAAEAQAAGRIAEARLQILQIDQDLQVEVGQELRDIQVQIGELTERKIAAENDLDQIDIRAPQAGIVHELAVHSTGAVVSPAEAIMQIVPEQDRLSVDAQVLPKDIDQIHLGQRTILRLSAFNQRTTPELVGQVSRVAADLTEDLKTGLSYYLVRITVPQSEIRKLKELTLVPGMPAEAFIQTGQRTALSYALKPLSDQLNRAFREE